MKILIKACANGNYGDDLFILSLLNRYAKNTNNECVLLVYQLEKYLFLQNKYNNVIVKQYPVPNVFQRALSKILQNTTVKKRFYEEAFSSLTSVEYDAFINVGGSLLARFDGEEFVLSNWIELLFAQRIKAKRKYLLNINILDGADESFYEECRKIFLLYDDVCFRDKISYNLFCDIQHCRYAPDMAFSLYPMFQQAGMRKNPQEKVLGINIINFNENKRLRKSRSGFIQKYEQCILDISKAFLERGYEIKLFAFDDRKEEQEYIKKIKEQIVQLNSLYSKKISMKKYSFIDIETFICEYCSCTKLLTTRFHAAISGLLADISFYPIVYDRKISNFLDSIDYSGEYSFLDNISSSSDIITSLELEHSYNKAVLLQKDDVFSVFDSFIETEERKRG